MKINVLHMNPEGVRLTSTLAGEGPVNWVKRIAQERTPEDACPADLAVPWTNIRTYVAGAIQDAFNSGVAFRAWIEHQCSFEREARHESAVDTLVNRSCLCGDPQAFSQEMAKIDSLAKIELDGLFLQKQNSQIN